MAKKTDMKTFTVGIMITTDVLTVWNVVPGRRKLGHDFQITLQADNEYDAIEQAKILISKRESEAA